MIDRRVDASLSPANRVGPRDLGGVGEIDFALPCGQLAAGSEFSWVWPIPADLDGGQITWARWASITPLAAQLIVTVFRTPSTISGHTSDSVGVVLPAGTTYARVPIRPPFDLISPGEINVAVPTVGPFALILELAG